MMQITSDHAILDARLECHNLPKLTDNIRQQVLNHVGKSWILYMKLCPLHIVQSKSDHVCQSSSSTCA